jgi:hypothetical protein
MLKPGDLVRLDVCDYPLYLEKIGILISPRFVKTCERGGIRRQWSVYIDGKPHDYFICESNIKAINENR